MPSNVDFLVPFNFLLKLKVKAKVFEYVLEGC